MCCSAKTASVIVAVLAVSLSLFGQYTRMGRSIRLPFDLGNVGHPRYTSDMVPSQEGKVAIVTGANVGLGKAITEGLALAGAEVIMACRSQERCNAAKADVMESVRSKTQKTAKLEDVLVSLLDLASYDSINAFLDRFKQSQRPLHILVNNAGIMAPLGEFKTASSGVELTFAVNHVGHQLLTTGLLPTLRASAPSRIVVMSSDSHRDTPPNGVAVNMEQLNQQSENYNPMAVYGQSKLANLCMAASLAKQLEDEEVYVNSVHPGVVATKIMRGVKDVGGDFGQRVVETIIPWIAYNTEEGAQGTMYLATSPDIVNNNIRNRYVVPLAEFAPVDNKAFTPELVDQVWAFTETLLENGRRP